MACSGQGTGIEARGPATATEPPALLLQARVCTMGEEHRPGCGSPQEGIGPAGLKDRGPGFDQATTGETESKITSLSKACLLDSPCSPF